MKGSRAFTRQEVLLLAGCTSSRLASLEKSELVVPDRTVGAVFFAWEQVIGIRMVKCLRSGLSLEQTKSVLDFLMLEKLLNPKLRLALVNDQPAWVSSNFVELPACLSSYSAAQIYHLELFITPPLTVFVQQARVAAAQHNLLDTLNSRLSRVR